MMYEELYKNLQDAVKKRAERLDFINTEIRKLSKILEDCGYGGEDSYYIYDDLDERIMWDKTEKRLKISFKSEIFHLLAAPAAARLSLIPQWPDILKFYTEHL